MIKIYRFHLLVFSILLIEILSFPNLAQAQCTVSGLSVNSYSDPLNLNTITTEFTWDVLENAEEYQVSYKILGNPDQVFSLFMNTNTFTVFSLVPNTTYTWRVNAKCDGVWATWPAYIEQFTTPDGASCEAQSLTSNIVVEEDNTISAQLTWDNELSDMYQVSYRKVGESQLFSSILSTNEHSLSVLEANSTYTWRVRTSCNGNWNAWPPYVEQFVTPNGTGCQPNELSVSLIENEDGLYTADLSWELTSAEAYQVSYREVGQPQVFSAILTSNSISLTDLLPNTTYKWRVKAQCNGTWTNWPPYTETFLTSNLDTTPPTVLTRDITASLSDLGIISIAPQDIDNGSFDDQSTIILALDIMDFDCSNIGVNDVTLTATDEAGNASSATALVTIVDDIAPVIHSNELTVSLDEFGNAEISVDELNNGSQDACGIGAITLDKTSFDCTDIGENILTLSVTDNNGNMSSETVTVYIIDDLAPNISASIDLISHHGRSRSYHHNIYQINYSAEDQCNESADVDGLITVPDISGFTVKLKRSWFSQKVKIDTHKKRIEIKSYNPQEIYESILETGGLKVANKSLAYLKLHSGSKHEYRLWRGWLYAAYAPEIELVATSTDASGNMAQASYKLGETLENNQDSNARIVDLDNEEETLSTELQSFDPVIYPVPSTGIFNISLTQDMGQEESIVSLFDISGSLIQQKRISGQNSFTAPIQIGNPYMQEGVYIVKIESKNSSTTKRVSVKKN
ncbi:MAG: T9SS type A sorting domain-containing protein [Reichenbachiella sp.]|uniref:fibronectin type III domain-containing protein n=1 Tax=Reichenbachiella sp. TaxID=2184521 RepID=UPI00329991BA